MKKLFSFLIFSMLFASCSQNSPKGIAAIFLDNIKKGDLVAAKKYGTTQTEMMLDMIISKGGPTKIDKVDYKILRDSLVGEDKALVIYVMGGKPKEEYLEMQKIEGQWKVNANTKKK